MVENVFVGCKMPNGVVLNLTSYEVTDEQRGSVRRVGEELGTVTLRGTQVPFGAQPVTINGYAFTPVPADFWEAWIAEHADMSLVKDGLIIVGSTMADAKAIGKERIKEPGQFEQLAENDSRVRSLGVKTFDPEDA